VKPRQVVCRTCRAGSFPLMSGQAALSRVTRTASASRQAARASLPTLPALIGARRSAHPSSRGLRNQRFVCCNGNAIATSRHGRATYDDHHTDIRQQTPQRRMLDTNSSTSQDDFARSCGPIPRYLCERHFDQFRRGREGKPTEA
jgi:hypothetical protein